MNLYHQPNRLFELLSPLGADEQFPVVVEDQLHALIAADVIRLALSE